MQRAIDVLHDALVALLLGHRSIETTRNFYCALEMPAAGREYSRNVIGRGAEPAPRNIEAASQLPLLVRTEWGPASS